MRKLIVLKLVMVSILAFSSFIGRAYASGYVGGYVDNDNQVGTLTPALILNLSDNITKNLSISNTLQYYYDDSSYQQWQQFDVPQAKFFTNQWLDNSLVATYAYGDTGLFSSVGYRMYEQLDSGQFSSRNQLTNGYTSDITNNLSQSTYLSVYQYNADGSFKLWAENDLHYKINDSWSIDANTALYRYANTNAIDSSYNLDELVQVSYSITKDASVYVSQELTRNLVSNDLANTTEVGMLYSF